MQKENRVNIRRVEADDWKAYQAIWMSVDQTEYAQYDVKHDTSDDVVRNKVAKWASLYDSMEHVFISVCLEDEVIGYIDAHKHEEGYEIGYCFHTDYHGKGYASESLSIFINRMKVYGAKKLTAGTGLRNTPSVNLLKKLGFVQTGTERVSFYKDENGHDIYFDGGLFELKL